MTQTMRNLHWLAWLLFVAGMCVWAVPANYWMSPNGDDEIEVAGRRLCTLGPGYALKGWQFGHFVEEEASGMALRATGTTAGIALVLERKALSSDSGQLEMVLTPQEELTLDSMHFALEFPRDMAVRSSYRLGDGELRPFPKTVGGVMLAHGHFGTFEVATPKGSLLVQCEPVARVMIQDSRQWGGGLTVRVCAPLPPGGKWSAGKPFRLRLVLRWKDGLEMHPLEPVTLAEGADWVALDTRLDIRPGSALDFSRFGFADAPAGKYGRLQARGAHFVFEGKPGVPQRFYGVNLCFSAHDLSHEESEQLAERLWRLGYNAVRYHHYETTLQASGSHDSTVLDPEKLERFDYLHAQLRAHGIYTTTDTFVSRIIRADEVFEGATGRLEMNEVKMLLPVNERMFENWKGFCRNFLGHVNPHTGLSYAQDPALAWISLINEGNFGNFFGSLSERVAKEWLREWETWTLEKYDSVSARNAAWNAPEEYAVSFLPHNNGLPEEQRDFARFQCDLEARMIRRMREFLRNELGCRALITDLNSWSNPTWTQIARQDLDYVDDHFYVDHPKFLEKRWRLPSRCDNVSPLLAGVPGGVQVAFTRLLDKPFTISEYNYSGPGRFRSVGGILTGCLAALQDWDAVWRFTYAHSNRAMFEPSPAGYFNVASDPLNQCAERAFLCLFLRGDMAMLPRTVAMTMDKHHLRGKFAPKQGIVPDWKALALLAKVGYRVEKDATDSDELECLAPAGRELREKLGGDLGLTRQDMTEMDSCRVRSATGQVVIDGDKNRLVIDTECTAGGFALPGGTIETSAVHVAILDTEATVWVSSLDGHAIPESRHLLITHLTDLQNSGEKYADARRRTILEWGHLPHLVREGRAEVTLLRPPTGTVEVWRLATDGERLSRVEIPVAPDGQLLVPLEVRGSHGAQMLYEVVFD